MDIGSRLFYCRGCGGPIKVDASELVFLDEVGGNRGLAGTNAYKILARRRNIKVISLACLHTVR